MRRTASFHFPLFTLAVLLGVSAATITAAGGFDYPTTRTEQVVDDYFGTKVADPYRWLEDSESPEVQTWVEAENAFTQAYLAKNTRREPIRRRLQQLVDYERYGVPVERNGILFFSHNDGLQNQSVFFVQKGLDGAPRQFLDPNTWRKDGTAALAAFVPSDDARYVAYGISLSGSDWQELHVREVASGKDLADRIPNIKFTWPAWTKDGQGFFYTRQPAPGSVPPGDEHYYMKLYYHRLGDDPEADRLLYERPDEKEAGFSPQVTADGRYLVVTVWKGTAEEGEVYFMPLDGKTWTLSPLRTGFDASYEFVGTDGNRFLFVTNYDAPRKRIISLDPAHPEPEAWTTIVPQSRDVISGATVADGKLVVQTMHDAHDRLLVYDLAGRLLHEVPLPTLGSVGRVSGRPGSDLLFFGFASFVYPTTIYRYDFASNQAVEYRTPQVDFDRDAYVTEQIWYESKDGTKVPMFLTHRKGLCLNGDTPTILYGYGGFNISITPYFSPYRLFWLEQGGMYAWPNLRGGGEFGQKWHEAGMLDKKQNVFDDFIAAAEYLIEHGYTRTSRLAIEGGSNGGLLTAAVEMQRPDLFGVVISEVPVADMLRYHLFTVGRFWIPEYGSSENPKQFPFLYAYSPLQNVRPGTKYPATLITTADTDDRVHPGQVRKLAATLQADNASDKPILLRVETRAGHGGGMPVAKRIGEHADIYGFVLHQMGLSVKERTANTSRPAAGAGTR